MTLFKSVFSYSQTKTSIKIHTLEIIIFNVLNFKFLMIIFKPFWKLIYPNCTHLLEPSESAQNIMNFIPGRDELRGRGDQHTNMWQRHQSNQARRRLSVSVARAIMGENGPKDDAEKMDSKRGRAPNDCLHDVARDKLLGRGAARGHNAQPSPGPTSATSFIINLPVTQRTPRLRGGKKCTTTACKGLWWVACLWLCVGALSLGVLSKNYYAY